MARPRPDAVAGFSGAVLAGGGSRRMGADKAMIVVEGRPLVLRVADALAAAGAAEVLIVGGDRTAIEALGLTYVDDAEPGAGPLGGMLAALAAAAHDNVVILATDIVDPEAGAIRRTVEALVASPDSDAAVPTVGGREQWLHAAWRRTCHDPLATVFASGERAIHRAVEAAGLRLTDVPGVAQRAVADADRPDDIPSR